MRRALLALGLLFAGGPALAQPLTLEQALVSVAEAHPDMLMAEADRAIALAERDLAGARGDWNLNLEAGLRRARPTIGPDAVSDNTLRLNARKSIYDFGRTAFAEQAAESVLAAREAALLDMRSRRRLDVMARFFDILLADMQFAADNEYMAVAYVNQDNARYRLEVGQIAAADLAEVENAYQDSLLKRNAAQLRQRISRAQLASAMNRPGQLNAELVDPVLAGNNRALPEFEALLPLLRARNPRLAAMRAQLAAATQRIEAVRADKSPALDLELEGAGYSREALTRDAVRAGVVLTWPLYTGRRVDAQMAKEQAQFQRLQAEAAKLELDLEQMMLENWLEIGELQRTARTAAKKHSDYRDHALERARGQYEVELKTNLGDSMAATMAAKLRERRIEYQLALAFARLEALLGSPVESAGTDNKG
ncbi:MAG: TolC family protein [Sulfurimicrobium sp.]|jgi:outer membrane protein TolC|nr:TolC family protein [Sulfurimicrobium sp.]MDO9189106.1 TolC family protein [Sulfurimicrobium sp.]MDP1704281.1 TolC family protein [Sulfurimicrobium sp.]MDP2197220.1 TolC family protein [Sulfurimicrobium sp.]MDP3687384.1 TolC family protein [Sulfurimicrobium sp.]